MFKNQRKIYVFKMRRRQSIIVDESEANGVLLRGEMKRWRFVGREVRGESDIYNIRETGQYLYATY